MPVRSLEAGVAIEHSNTLVGSKIQPLDLAAGLTGLPMEGI